MRITSGSGFLGTSLLVFLIAAFITLQHVHQASPNEWLLVVDAEGEQVKATVGGTHIAQPWQKVVKFPATLQKVSFQAQQVSREMQGIEVSGFASWVVFREHEGPLKAYRHLNGLTEEGIEGANDSLRVMAESILRAKLANLTIHEVLKGRELLRDACRTAMMEVVGGWGVWIETLEVTEVKVLSSSLFANMQTKYREEQRLTSEMDALETQQQITKRKAEVFAAAEKIEADSAHELAVHRLELQLKKDKLAAASQNQKLVHQVSQDKLAAEARNQQLVHQAEQDMLVQEHSAALSNKKHELEQQRRQREHEAELLTQKLKLELETLANMHQREEQSKQNKLELLHLQNKLQVEQSMTEANHRSALLQATKDVYSKLPLRDVKLVNFGAASNTNSSVTDMGLLPGLWAGVQS